MGWCHLRDAYYLNDHASGIRACLINSRYNTSISFGGVYHLDGSRGVYGTRDDLAT